MDFARPLIVKVGQIVGSHGRSVYDAAHGSRYYRREGV